MNLSCLLMLRKQMAHIIQALLVHWTIQEFCFFQFVKIRFIFHLFRLVLSSLFQLVLTTRQTCFHLCHGLQKWYPHTARKNGVWYLNLTGHPYSSGGKVGFLKTLKYIVRDLVRLKRKNFIKAATKNRVRIDQSLCYLIWMGC